MFYVSFFKLTHCHKETSENGKLIINQLRIIFKTDLLEKKIVFMKVEFTILIISVGRISFFKIKVEMKRQLYFRMIDKLLCVSPLANLKTWFLLGLLKYK